MTVVKVENVHDKLTFEQLCHKVIWETLMEGTAHCGWTDMARKNLVENMQNSISWAIAKRDVASLELKVKRYDEALEKCKLQRNELVDFLAKTAGFDKTIHDGDAVIEEILHPKNDPRNPDFIPF